MLAGKDLDAAARRAPRGTALTAALILALAAAPGLGRAAGGVDPVALVPSGMPHSALQALTAPALVAAAAAGLKPGERVIGVVIGGQARAYPLALVAAHQAVNDNAAGRRPLLVTYSPLTGSAMVFDPTIDGKPAVFGVSDRLYQGAPLFYDLATHSLWSQVDGSAIAGPMRGRSLSALPSTVTNWSLWRKFHGDSLVLTGPAAPLPAKVQSPLALHFPDSRLPADAMVLGIDYNHHSEVFPIQSLVGLKVPLSEEVGGRDFTIVYDTQSNTAGVASQGKHVAAYLGYWFAWAAVHPKSVIIGEPPPPKTVEPRTFAPAAPLPEVREAQSATLLRNGEVLVVGGDSGGPRLLARTELYDPAHNKWLPGPALKVARGGQSATLLADGDVLIAGGIGTKGDLGSAELYEARRGRFVEVGQMAAAREGHSATLLRNGEVLIAGGNGADGTLRSAELYDPRTRRFTPTGNMTTARAWHTATLMADGRVLIAGGTNAEKATLASAEIYDPATGRFTPTDDMMSGRQAHCAALLPDGRVLIAGGDGEPGSLRSAEIYDPVKARFMPTASMLMPREGATAVTLRDGRILVVGGALAITGFRMDVPTAEIYDPKSGRFIAAGRMSIGRYRPTATLLADGSILVTGRYAEPGSDVTRNVEIFHPLAPAKAHLTTAASH
jgi:hypothetical protein